MYSCFTSSSQVRDRHRARTQKKNGSEEAGLNNDLHLRGTTLNTNLNIIVSFEALVYTECHNAPRSTILAKGEIAAYPKKCSERLLNRPNATAIPLRSKRGRTCDKACWTGQYSCFIHTASLRGQFILCTNHA